MNASWKGSLPLRELHAGGSNVFCSITSSPKFSLFNSFTAICSTSVRLTRHSRVRCIITSAKPTKALYQTNEHLRSHKTHITTITPITQLPEIERVLFKNAVESNYVLETAETIFYAQGGGQPCDTGYISLASHGSQEEKRFHVGAVRHGSEGRILHLVNGDRIAEALRPGGVVEQHIDGVRRDRNSRAHTAGHIVGLALRRLVQQTPGLDVTELKASHFPDACFVAFKGSISGEYKDVIQAQASEYVRDALRIELSWCRPEELRAHGVITTEGMPIVVGSAGRVRVVDIVGAGKYPCGGTHVPDTSWVGKLTIKGIKRQKGVSKVSYTIADVT